VSAGGSLPPDLRVVPPGPRSRETATRLGLVECPAFEERRRGRALASGLDASGIVLARGRGANVWDVDDNRYVDLAAGFGAAILGHGPSPAHDAARAQLDVLVQGLGDLYASDVKVKLLERLAALHPTPGARVMLCQSGADAVTAALKTATLATERSGLVAFEGAYHGLSYAPLAACGLRESFRAPFREQLNPNVAFVPYPRSLGEEGACLAAAREALGRVGAGALIIEPILGRGGVHAPSDAFLRELASLTRESGALFVADEIWTGLGRSGAMLKSVAAGVVPDILCVGKGLGAGFPISACIATDAAMRGWARGGEVLHTSTHAGAPLGCAAALATLDAVETQRLDARARDLGGRLVAALRDAFGSGAEVRGEGLIVGIDTRDSARGLSVGRRLLESGYVTTSGGRGAEVIVLTPPLTISEDQLFGVVPALAEALAAEAAR
jgi:4-aminobutyrate aminotransferase/(S)-3-amino-2-methylpropionate transaminase